MDFFDQSVDYSRIVDNINDKKDELLKRRRKTFAYTLAILIVIGAMVSVLLFADPFRIVLILLTTLIAPFIISNIVRGITFSAHKNVLKNKVLNDEVIKLYNMDFGTFFDYIYKPKNEKLFNKEMGLFTRYATVNNKFVVSGSSGNHHKFKIFNTSLTTSDGKNTSVHFDGMYVVLDVKTNSMFQIRSNGKPHLKQQKFTSVEDAEFKTYVSEDNQTSIEDKYYDILRSFNTNFDSKKVYLASNKNELHLAISIKRFMKIPDEITYDSFKEYSDEFVKFISMVLEFLEKLDDY